MAHFASWSDIVSEDWPEEVVSVKRRAGTEFLNDNYSGLPKVPKKKAKVESRSLSDVMRVRRESRVNLPRIARNSDDVIGFSKNSQSYNDKMTTANLLPGYIQYIMDEESLQNFNAYALSIKSEDQVSAQMTLERMLKKASNDNEKTKILKSAFDINKKHSRYKDALDILQEAMKIDPQNITFPLESAKLLNEIGRFEEEDKLLFEALKNTNFNNMLLTKMLKSLERRSMLSKARSVLGTAVLKNKDALLEGVLFEIRHGPADAVLYLIDKCRETNTDWRGSVYLEIVEFCARRGLVDAVLRFAEAGFKEVPSLFALCGIALRFQNNEQDAIRVYESSCEASQMARPRLAPTLANVLMRMGNKQLGHQVLAHAIVLSSPDIKSKLFYNAAILCIFGGEMQFVQMLLAQGKLFCQRKAQLPFDVLRAKIQEISGFQNAAAEANRIFIDIINNYPDDWHSHIEYILFLARHNRMQDAMKALNRVLASFPDNGRLLALKVQLEAPEKQVEAFVDAIHQAPKSGEVWLEGARIALNPLSPYFSLKDARFFLNIAHLFTPQYLDIFVDMCRLEMLENGLYGQFYDLQDKFINSEGNQGTVFLRYRILGKEFTKEEFNNMVNGVREDLKKNAKLYAHSIARSSFVPSSLKEELERITNESSKTRFTFGLSTFGKGNILDVLGISASFLT